MPKHFVCDGQTSFASVLQTMRQRERLFGPAIYRGQSNPDWPLQSTWERRFCEIQRAGLYEPYRIQRYEDVRVALQKAFLTMFRGTVEPVMPEARIRTDDELWALGRHHGLVTPLLDWTLDPYIAAYFALRHLKPGAAVWALHVSDSWPSGMWNEDYFSKVAWPYHSDRQRLQEGVFTRLSHPIFGDLENYLRNVLPAMNLSACLVKIEIQESAMPNIIREFERREIDDDLLGFTGQSENSQLDEIATRCNASLPKIAPGGPVPKIDNHAVLGAAERLAEEYLATVRPGEARPTGRRAFPFLRPFPEQAASLLNSKFADRRFAP